VGAADPTLPLSAALFFYIRRQLSTEHNELLGWRGSRDKPEAFLNEDVPQCAITGNYKRNMLDRYVRTWFLCPDKHVASDVRKCTMRSKEIKVRTCFLWSEMSQDKDGTNPPGRGSPDLFRLCLFLFDLDPNEALDHCKNQCLPGSNEPECVFSRVMRS
jgi:hypothetical protein